MLQARSVTAAFSIRWLIVGLPAEALADRWPRRTIVITANLLRAVVLTVLSILIVTGHATLPILTTTILVVGIARCFFDASPQAVTPSS